MSSVPQTEAQKVDKFECLGFILVELARQYGHTNTTTNSEISAELSRLCGEIMPSASPSC